LHIKIVNIVLALFMNVIRFFVRWRWGWWSDYR